MGAGTGTATNAPGGDYGEPGCVQEEEAEVAQFKESDHARAPEGKFGSGGGTSQIRSRPIQKR
jgi:hypothetical protein